MEEFYADSICQVLVNDCSETIIFNTLNHFLAGYNKLSLDYVDHPEGKSFKSEKELVSYFIKNKIPQLFYWNLYDENPDEIMIGADILPDGKLVISLTLSGTDEKAEKYFTQLKSHLHSDVGVISHVVTAEYEDGKDFERRYGRQAS